MIIDVLPLLLDASFPAISTEPISRVMRSLGEIREIGSIRVSCLCHGCVTRLRESERETRLVIFRDTVLPSRNSEDVFARDEDGTKSLTKIRKEKKKRDDVNK